MWLKCGYVHILRCWIRFSWRDRGQYLELEEGKVRGLGTRAAFDQPTK